MQDTKRNARDMNSCVLISFAIGQAAIRDFNFEQFTTSGQTININVIEANTFYRVGKKLHFEIRGSILRQLRHCCSSRFGD